MEISLENQIDGSLNGHGDINPTGRKKEGKIEYLVDYYRPEQEPFNVKFRIYTNSTIPEEVYILAYEGIVKRIKSIEKPKKKDK